jgi:DNA-binding protein YbaB
VDEQKPAAAGTTETAERLRAQSARLSAAANAAAEVSYRASADAGQPGELAVTATGLGRVAAIQLGPKAVGAGAQALGPALSRLLNEAIAGAKDKAAQAQAAEPSLRAALLDSGCSPDTAEQLTAKTVNASSPGEQVTVTASGTGEITEVRFAATALKGDDHSTLAEQITTAANGAIDAAQQLQRELSGSARPGEQELDKALDAQLSDFNRQMDELLNRLDQAGKRIADLND